MLLATVIIIYSCFLGKDVQSKWNEVKTLVPQRDQTLQETTINQSIYQLSKQVINLYINQNIY